MRIVNDKERAETSSPASLVAVASYGLMSAIAISTLIFGPLPMIAAHLRLSEPWPKITALLGALLALTVLDVPLMVVVIVFIFGLFIADNVVRGSEFWPFLIKAVALGLSTGVLIVLVMAEIQKVSPVAYWSQTVEGLVQQFQKALPNEEVVRLDLMKTIFLFEGPFLYVAALMLSFWLCVGLVAHLNWLSPTHPLSATSLRKVRLPLALSVVFVAIFVSTFVGEVPTRYVLNGVFRVMSGMMIIQGCVCLSAVLSIKMVRPRVRTALYSFSILFGLPVLIVIGVISPWLFRNNRMKEPVSGGLEGVV